MSFLEVTFRHFVQVSPCGLGRIAIFNIEAKDRGNVSVGTGYIFISQPRQLFLGL